MVAVIILNWNGEDLLKTFLPAVVARTPALLGRVVVADNASTDHSVQWLEREYPQVQLIRLDRNYGFAGGYNRAIAQVEEETVVLLNSDVEVGEGWLAPLVEAMNADPRLAAVQPKIRAWKEKTKFEYAGACGGYIDYLGFPFCRGRLLNSVEEDFGQYDNPAEVFWCSGAALCIRRQCYLEAGGLDERFFAHMEEIDLCWRLRNAGWRLQAVPASVVWHLGGGSLPMNHPRKLFLNYRNNLLMLYKNLDKSTRRKVMLGRFFMDSAACGMFLLRGEKANARAVVQAYREYRKMKSGYTSGNPRRQDTCIFRKSVILAYYFRHIRKFSELWK